MLPIGEAGYYSLFRWNGYGEPSQWVEFSNYVRLFNHSAFDTAVWNTLKIIVISLVIQLPLALIIALSIYKKAGVTAYSDSFSSCLIFWQKWRQVLFGVLCSTVITV
ncbi:hypothetical protein [Marinomonas rhodophyticola]|uniref:Uncharacterized protein n=1 Tax=Marinomonas rhodophyticola TaxID=2992803 RepID=A0ABT3KD99_9GAMM|nr:hypothetical protein [Marinomonas sp. KJ51-3]MCW4628141.1 hypothetical protein [Marinomonas sp. KJ51-3]